jgi:hypothetical protein
MRPAPYEGAPGPRHEQLARSRPRTKETNPYRILSGRRPVVPPDLAESRRFNTATQQYRAGAAARGALLLKMSKTTWTWDITSMSARPLVCGTGQRRPQEMYYQMHRTNDRSTGQARRARAPPLATRRPTLVRHTSLHFSTRPPPRACGPCFELTEYSNTSAPLATSGDLGRRERHACDSYNASTT